MPGGRSYRTGSPHGFCAVFAVAVMAHMGMIHRACARLSEENEETPWRPMLKFIFSSAPKEADLIKGGVPRCEMIHTPLSQRRDCAALPKRYFLATQTSPEAACARVVAAGTTTPQRSPLGRS
jgi:hypothetical protein